MAILSATEGKQSERECRMLRQGEIGQIDALDLRVSACPLKVEDQSFIMVTVFDISNEKRRQALERIFFHDILNTAGAMKGLADMLVEMNIQEEDIKSITGLLQSSSDQLIDEIQAQRTLGAAERNELQVAKEPIELLPFVRRIASLCAAHDVARGRFVSVDSQAANISVETDKSLLGRVVLNLLKNALEASRKGETVTVNVVAVERHALITVHNVAVMPDMVKNQVFHRSFSTRGAGRGLGTYSVKLLTERYLGGKVTFDSVVPDGTTFEVMLPLCLAS